MTAELFDLKKLDLYPGCCLAGFKIKVFLKGEVVKKEK